MNRPFGSRTVEEWDAHLAGLVQSWRALVGQSSALRERQAETLRLLFSGTGLSDAQADTAVARYLERLNAAPAAADDLAGFIRASWASDRDAHPVLPPAIDDIPALTAALWKEWERMFSLLPTRLASPRSRALLAARAAPAQPGRSLAEAVLAPVKDVAPLHDPRETQPVASLGLDGELDAKGKPTGPEPVGDKISHAVFEHLRLRREIRKLDDSWTNDAEPVAAFVRQRAPQPSESSAAPAPARVRWLASWFRKTRTAAAPAAARDARWREPVPPHVPTDPKLVRQLHEWRARTEKEAESLKAADAAWTERVSRIGSELAARRAAEARHPPLDLDPEALAQGGLEEARILLDVEFNPAIALAEAARAAIDAAQSGPASPPVSS